MRSDAYFDGLPESGEQERCERVPRTHDTERVRLREAVYSQYRNLSLPSLNSAFEYRSTANLVHSAMSIGDATSFIWKRTKLAVATREAGFYFCQGPNH